MSGRPSPERTAELREQVARGILNVKGSGDSAVAALDELVAALAAETARADEAEESARQRLDIGYSIKDDLLDAINERDARAARLEQAREALHEWRHGADWQGEGSGQMPDRVALLRLEELLAALQETPPNGEAT